jgi:hypothetical protein
VLQELERIDVDVDRSALHRDVTLEEREPCYGVTLRVHGLESTLGGGGGPDPKSAPNVAWEAPIPAVARASVMAQHVRRNGIGPQKLEVAEMDAE